MTVLNIEKYGSKVLRQKSQNVNEMSKDIKLLANDMLETMYFAKGVGLAAPQVGKLLRLCVIDVDEKQKSPIVMVNPEVVFGEDKKYLEEGCLSIPSFYEKVKRFDKVTAKYTGLDGNKKEVCAQGFFAVAIQHEIDHLDAKLFIDYLPGFKRKIIEKEIKRKRKMGDW
ncbi:MAG: peptide deformylase [Endomicrobium sp.]|jgi:peptide deformylase|uniref:peptide deformylase n=1 Tax=Candidatus Endomicrobiellum cubanum TaxID=3242325 RepID=UPI002829B041|nr:peptide deformylase [Endomicrobium sp.]